MPTPSPAARPVFALGQRPEEKSDEQSDLSREARILLAGGNVPGDRGESDDPKRHRGNSDAADAIAQPAEERDQRESPDPRGSPLRSPTLATLALNPEQQTDAERDEQADRRIAHRSPRRQPRTSSAVGRGTIGAISGVI